MFRLTEEEKEMIRTGSIYKSRRKFFRKLEELWWRIDAAIIMWRVNRDPVARNAVPPEGMYEELMEKIRAMEEEKDTQ